MQGFTSFSPPLLCKSELFHNKKLKETERKQHQVTSRASALVSLVIVGKLIHQSVLVLHLPIQRQLETNKPSGVSQKPSFQSLGPFDQHLSKPYREGLDQFLSACESYSFSVGVHKRQGL